LHQRDHRRPEGGAHHPPELHLRQRGRPAYRRGHHRGGQLPQLPAPAAHLRAQPSGVVLRVWGCCGVLPGRPPQDHGGLCCAEANLQCHRAAAAEPAARQDPGRGGRRRGGQAGAVRARAGGQDGRPARGHHAARALGCAGLWQAPCFAGLGPAAGADHGLRPRGALRAGPRQVHPGGGGPAGGVRADGDHGRGHRHAPGRPHGGPRGRARALLRAPPGRCSRHGVPAHGHVARRRPGQRWGRGRALPRARRDLLQGPQRLRGLLQDAGEDSRGDRRRGLAALGGHRPVDPGGQAEDHRPEEEPLQAGAGRVRGPRARGERAAPGPPGGAGLRARGFPGELFGCSCCP
ncbi:unnamed protein product, partial [Heterosigma akashiwo]